MRSAQDHRHIEFAILNIRDLESSGGWWLCGSRYRRLCCCRSSSTGCQDQCRYDCQKQELTHCLLLLKESVGMEQTTTKNLIVCRCASFRAVSQGPLSIQLY